MKAAASILVALSLFGSLVGCVASVQEPAHGSESATTTTTTATSGSNDIDVDLEEGKPAPDFISLAQDGSRVALSELRGRTVILFFYTKDETPLALREVTDFRDAAKGLKEQGIAIVGVSTDSLETHRAVAERLKLPYPLLSDPNGTIARAFAVPVHYGLADRRTFVIGPNGVIEKIYRDVPVPTHVADVVASVSRKEGED